MSGRLLVLYASQTGCAQDCAECIAREAKARCIPVALRSMDDYDKANLVHESCVVFVCSTAGQGDEPDSMKGFWKFLLRKSLPADVLSHLEFTVFGLGDSSYEKYNYPAKKLHKRLLQLGARSLYPKGEGDDQHYLGAYKYGSVDGTFAPWRKGLWQVLQLRYPTYQEPAEQQARPLPRYRFRQPNEAAGPHESSVSQQLSGFVMSTVVQNDRLTSADHFQDVRHITLQLPSGTQLSLSVFSCCWMSTHAARNSYAPGDVACVLPQNDPKLVDELLAYMQWQDIADDAVVLEPSEAEGHGAMPRLAKTQTTLRQILTHLVSPFSTPRRYFFELMSFFADTTTSLGEQQREKLLELASTQGQDALLDYAARPKRTCFEVLQDFTACKFPAEYVFDFFSEMRERQFSIASACTADSAPVGAATVHLELCVAVVQYKTKLHIPRAGVCTTWLGRLAGGDAVPIKIRRGTFRLPKDIATPVICIGPGTGVAPMKSLVEERTRLGATENYLFFGSRNAAKDYYYEQQWSALIEQGKLNVYTAFSRDQEGKVYVQHSIRKHGALVYDLITRRNAHIYLSGNANRMPVDVRDTLVAILQSEGNLSRDAAQAYLAQMKSERRFQEETW
ncbi:NAPDH-dependent diflavin reductase [Sorochytrium milnesiophthora]